MMMFPPSNRNFPAGAPRWWRPAAAGGLSRLLLALILLPLGALAQGGSSIDVETAPGVWSFCSSDSQPGSVVSPLTSPDRPQVGDDIAFRIRKNSPSSSSEFPESLHLDRIEYAPVSGQFMPRTEFDVGFGSFPELPAFFTQTSQTEFDIFFMPSEGGVYRFYFSSQTWDGGLCTVEVPVTDCFITFAEGINHQGNSAVEHLDFGVVPVRQDVMGLIQLGFASPVTDELITFSPVHAPFQISPVPEFESDLMSATWDVTFTPTEARNYRETVTFTATQHSEDPGCSVDVLLEGDGGEAPELTITFGELMCGTNLEIPVLLSNPSSLLLQNLDARATSGFNLAPDPPGSFAGTRFALGPAGSADPPSQRRFILRYPLVGGIPPNPLITVSDLSSSETVVLLQEPIPPAGCIEIIEPANFTLNFRDVVVNTSAPQQSIVVANRGNNAETVTALLAANGPGQGFGLDGGVSSVNLVIPGRSQQMLPVSFRPPSVGQKQSSVSFMSEVTGDLPNVALIGNGVDEPQPSLRFELSGTPVNPGGTIGFPATELGRSSPLTLVITNNGNAGALGLGVSAANGEFSVASVPPLNLAPSQSTNYVLTFSPAQAGTRSGQLTVSGQNFDTVTFSLTGQGVMGAVDIDGVGLSANVVPAQMPLPTVGLELQGGAATQLLEGDLLLEFVPNLSNTPTGFLQAYQAVGFMAAGGGRAIRFRFELGQQRALFPEEDQANRELARFQTGTVAGSIQFRLQNVTLGGVPVTLVDQVAGNVTVARLAPMIRSMTTPETGTGINLVTEAVSTSREITGVCLALQAAAGTQLTFTRPDPGFLNTDFARWFNENSQSFGPGGAFRVTIPIDLSNRQTFGSAQIWLRNSEGWSSPNSPCQ